MSAIGDLKSLINNKEVTVYEASNHTGVSASVLHKIVNGETKKPNKKTIEHIRLFILSKINEKRYEKYSNIDTLEVLITENKNLKNQVSILKEELNQAQKKLIDLLSR